MSDTTTKNPDSPVEQQAGPQQKAWITRGVEYPVLADINPMTGTPDMDSARTWDQLSEEEREFSREQGFYYGNWDKNEAPIRRLTADERKVWGEAVFQATVMLPAFSPSIGIMSPGRDRTSGTVYTDAQARVGLGDKFFYEWNPRQRATAVIHESMHVLYNHFDRFKRMTDTPNQLTNIAGDFEINGALGLHSRCDISMGVHPENKINVAPDHPWAPLNGKPMWGADMKVGKSAEEYYSLLEKEAPEKGDGEGEGDGQGGQGQGGGQPGSGQCPVHGQPGDSQSDAQGEGSEGGSEGQGDGGERQHGGGSGNSGSSCSCQGWSCGSPSEEKSEELEEAGVKGTSDTEKENARANTKSKIVDERKTSRAAGNGSNDAFLSLVLDQLQDPKVPWQSLFRQVITRAVNNIIAGRTDYSYRRSNRRMSGSRYIFPGTVSYLPEVAFGIDTSGSMAKSDYMALLQEAEVIVKTVTKGGKGLSVFNVDTEITAIQRVKSIHDINLQGGGGTDMSVAFKYINDLPLKERPDVFILSTDGGFGWHSVIDELSRREAKGYKSIILITDKWGFENVPDEAKRLATIIDVSPEDED